MADVLLLTTGDRLLLTDGTSRLLLAVQPLPWHYADADAGLRNEADHAAGLRNGAEGSAELVGVGEGGAS